MYSNKTLLITGGTGSFGNQVLKRFLQTEIEEIRIFSRDEKKQEEMRQELGDHRVKFYIGDVRNYQSVLSAMRNVNFVFHAAALKQVPSCEFYPQEAVATNVHGADNVMNAALACEVEKVVLLSTDKAVYPINAMGLSKAMMEKFMVAKARTLSDSDTLLCATRYGNVMASRGSVIPLFVSQLKNNEQITITDPEMTRFLMSLDQSVDLVQYAFNHADQGDIFVQKAPAATIEHLYQALAGIFNSKSARKVIGTRHGEKLFESLVSREEMARSEDMGAFYRIPADARDLNYNLFYSEGEHSIEAAVDYTSHNTERLNVQEVTKLLLDLEYIKKQLSVGR